MTEKEIASLKRSLNKFPYATRAKILLRMESAGQLTHAEIEDLVASLRPDKRGRLSKKLEWYRSLEKP
jgi:hypothetical protein